MTPFSLSVQVWGSSRRFHLHVWWPLPEGLSWWEVHGAWCMVHGEWKHQGWRLWQSWRRDQVRLLGEFLLLLYDHFIFFMTDRSLQTFLVSCLPLDCQKGLLTYLYPHTVVLLYLFTWNGYWSVEFVLFLARAPPRLQSFADSDHISVTETSGNHRKSQEVPLSSLCHLGHFRVTLSSICTQCSPLQFWVFTWVPFQVLPFLWNV